MHNREAVAAWRLVVQQVYAAGGQAPRRHIVDATSGALRVAQAYQLLVYSPDGWALTPLGRDWCEGRVVQIAGRHPIERELLLRRTRCQRQPPPGRHLRFAATWLASLPRDMRISGQAGRVNHSINS